jgi:hypothetical protein
MQWNSLTDKEIRAIVDALPEGLEGFSKYWGWKTFAACLDDAIKQKNMPTDLNDLDVGNRVLLSTSEYRKNAAAFYSGGEGGFMLLQECRICGLIELKSRDTSKPAGFDVISVNRCYRCEYIAREHGPMANWVLDAVIKILADKEESNISASVELEKPAPISKKDLIQHITERFLGWKLPEDFAPDGGISFEPLFNKGTKYEMRHEPSGTNLLNYDQAYKMVEYCLDLLFKDGTINVQV